MVGVCVLLLARSRDTHPPSKPRSQSPTLCVPNTSSVLGAHCFNARHVLTHKYVGATPLVLQDVRLNKGGSFETTIPTTSNAFAYVYRGAATVCGRTVKEGQMAVLEGGGRVSCAAPSESGNILVLSGEPINEPVARYGPFVMNTRVRAFVFGAVCCCELLAGLLWGFVVVAVCMYRVFRGGSSWHDVGGFW